MVNGRNLIALILLVFALASAAAQTPAMVPRRLVLFASTTDDAVFERADLLTLYETLLIKLSGAESDFVVFEPPDINNPPKLDSEKSRITGQMEADAWLSVEVGGSIENMRLHVRSFDLHNREVVIDLVLEKSGTRGIERRFWDDVVNAAKEKYEKLTQKILGTKIETGEVTIHALPGTEIVGLTEESLIVGPEGEAKAFLFTQATYTFEAKRPGYYPYKLAFYLDQPSITIECEQDDAARLAFDFYFNKLSYPGLAYSFYFIPSYFFVRAGLTYFYLGMPLMSDPSQTNIPMTNISASVGIYFNNPEHVVRVYAAAGAFIRMINLIDRKAPERSQIGFEPLSFLGFFPVLGVEFSGLPNIRFYAEYRPLFYFVQNAALISAYYQYREMVANQTPPPGFEMLGSFIFDTTNFNVGVRLQF